MPEINPVSTKSIVVSCIITKNTCISTKSIIKQELVPKTKSTCLYLH